MAKSLFGKMLGRKEKETAVAEKTKESIKEEKAASPDQFKEKIQIKAESKPDFATEYEGQLAIDVYQTDSDIVIKSTIAGVKPEDVDVTIDNDMVTVKGKRRQDESIPKENYFYQECYWGPFSRSVILPQDIETDKVSAELKNGILTVRLPKVDKSKVKKISVRAVS